MSDEVLEVEIRNDVRVSVEFTTEDGAAIDPDEVRLEVRPPTGTSPDFIEYVFPTDVIIEKTGVGEYNALLYVDVEGDWSYTWVATGELRGARSGCITGTLGCRA